MTGYKKPSVKISAPRSTKAPGVNSFARMTPGASKGKAYTKDILKQDPMAFASKGFGDTGLDATPSLLSTPQKMKKTGKLFP